MDLRFFILDYVFKNMIDEYVKSHQITDNFIMNFSDGCYNPHISTFLTFKEFYNHFVNVYYYSPRIKLPRRNRITYLCI